MLDVQAPLQSSERKHKALHVLVPEAAHMQARMAAIASRVPFKVFMAHLMLSATPIEVGPASTCIHPALAGLCLLQPSPASVGDADSLNTSMKGK